MLSEAEMREVESMRRKHPAVEAELQAIEDALAMAAQVNYRQPKAELLDRIMDRIDQEEKQSQSQATIKPLSSPTSNRFKWIAIAAALLLLLSLASNFYLFNELGKVEQSLAQVRAENDDLSQEFASLQTNYDRLLDLDFSTIRMAGQPASPNSYAAVLWNKEVGTVLLNTGNLPEVAEDQQFQLWAIIEGQGPVSAGVFDLVGDILEMPDIKGKVIAFALTLEPKGGSESPTLDQIYVLGEAS